MRKLSIYILILIAIVGVFSPRVNVNAILEEGCYTSDGIPAYPKVDKATCESKKYKDQGYYWFTPPIQCIITSATFTPSGFQPDSWYTSKPRVRLDVVGTSGCLGRTIEVSIAEKDSLTPDDDIAEFNNKTVTFNTKDTSFSVNFVAGETDCDSEKAPDCDYYAHIYKSDGPDFLSDGKPGGNLQYNCTFPCWDNWTVGETIKGPPVPIEDDTLGDCTITVDVGPPEVKKNITQKDCTKLGGVWTAIEALTSTYNFLAPLPCDTNANPPIPGCVDGKFTTFDAVGDNKIGTYINIMLKLFIGICAVLAFVMIVIGGLEYLTSDLISSKEHGKERISGAIFGLILALGAYVLLFTINPDLLNTDLKLKTALVEVTLEPEPGIQGKVTTVGNTSVTACDETQLTNITLFGKSARVNKAVVNDLKKVDTAWNAMPEATRYKVNSLGSYNCREVKNKPGYWSMHAFGLALDINPSTNPYGKDFKTDMPAEFINLFTSTAGWTWGGSWINLKDPMHYSSNGK